MNFRIAETETTLLDAKNTPEFRDAFAAQVPVRTVAFDPAALELISNALELDADGLLMTMKRYAAGQFRAKAKGPRYALGEFGEALTFLLRRAAGDAPVRVIKYQIDGGVEEGERYPMPDFIVPRKLTDGSSVNLALEVKSTEALDYQELLTHIAPRRWCWLAPCRAVERLRKEALPQLGFTSGGQAAGYQHKLALLNNSACPFPVDQGLASAVLAVDGRLAGVKGNKRLKTPRACAQVGRNCWRCLEATDGAAHARVVYMRNAPGRLALLGSYRRGEWVAAYRRWEQAMWSREATAVRETSNVLGAATRQWMTIAEDDSLRHARDSRRPDEESRHVSEGWQRLSDGWRAYTEVALTQRGLGAVASSVAAVFRRRPELGAFIEEPVLPRSLAPAEPAIVEVGRPQWPTAGEGRVRVSVPRDNTAPYSFTLMVDEGGWEIRSCSDAWWSRPGQSVDAIADEVASRAAAQAIQAGLQHHGYANVSVPRPQMVRVYAHIEDSDVFVGFRIRHVTEGAQALPPRLPSWVNQLWSGDGRVKLFVHPDGRTYLRVSAA